LELANHPLDALVQRKLVDDVRHVDVAALGQVAVVQARAGGREMGQMDHRVDALKQVAVLVHTAQV